MIYLDASALVALLAPDVHSAAAAARLEGSTDVVLSDFTTAEVYATLAVKGRRGELTAAQVAGAADECARFGRDEAICHPLHAADGQLATSFVRRFDLKLRAPDALHLAICRRVGAALLTFDARQAEAAEALGIALA